MSRYHSIVEAFHIEEIQASDEMKEAIRLCVESLLVTESSFPVALKMASILTDNYRMSVVPADVFAGAHIENNVNVYSNPQIYMAYYLLMLAGKARNLFDVQAELKEGRIADYQLVCACDSDTCATCKEKLKAGKIAEISYETVPPYHVGCRCGLIMKAGDNHGNTGS